MHISAGTFLALLCCLSAVLGALATSPESPGGLLAAAAASASGPPPALAGGLASRSSAAADPLPDLLHPLLDAKTRAGWTVIGRKLWDDAITRDVDFVDSYNSVVPFQAGSVQRGGAAGGSQPLLPPQKLRSSSCGRMNRLWTRMLLHDCGTYSKHTRQHGCNGSLRKELPPGDSPVIIDGIPYRNSFEPLVMRYGLERIDANWTNSEHPENAGFGPSVAFFIAAKLEAEDELGFRASVADVLVYAGFLALARCGGPLIMFEPGRLDSEGPDPPGLLPSPDEPPEAVLAAHERTGLSALDAVVLGAANSISCFRVGCQDSTPARLDPVWARELLDWDGEQPPPCEKAGLPTLDKPLSLPAAGAGAGAAASAGPGLPPPPSARCKARTDAGWLHRNDTRRVLELLAGSRSSPDADLADKDSIVASLTSGLPAPNYGSMGLLRANVESCYLSRCTQAQWRLNQLFGSSYSRVARLLPQPQQAAARAATPASGGGCCRPPALEAAAALKGRGSVSVSASRDETDAERQSRVGAWAAFVERTGGYDA